ncbi:hypothetical protein OSTOST_06614 [Ostertagia ostertagi]
MYQRDQSQMQNDPHPRYCQRAPEKKRADALDCELSEQTELTEKASRQAAEAENESNRRLAECLEMETRRAGGKGIRSTSEYYSQLQAAYNVIYAKLKQIETEKAVVEKEQQTASSSTHDQNVEHVVDTMISELHLESIVSSVFRAKLEQHHLAIAEHRRTNEALNEQLRCLEEETQKAGGETVDAKARLMQLEGELEWKQDECDSLRRRVSELQAAIDQLVERNNETDGIECEQKG